MISPPQDILHPLNSVTIPFFPKVTTNLFPVFIHLPIMNMQFPVSCLVHLVQCCQDRPVLQQMPVPHSPNGRNIWAPATCLGNLYKVPATGHWPGKVPAIVGNAE